MTAGLKTKYGYLIITLSSLLILILSHTLSAQIPAAPGTTNVTARYFEISRHYLFHSQLIPTLKQHKVLLVPGFMSNAIVSGQKILQKTGVLGAYFADQIHWFRVHGVDHERLNLHSESPPWVNAPIIIEAIERSDKPVIMLTHSKGGLDTLEALLTSSHARNKVKGWIALQTPFWGTPLADAILENPPLRFLVFPIMRGLNGSPETILTLSLGYRRAYFQMRNFEIQTLMEQVPTVALATWKWNTPGTDTVMEPMRNWMQNRGYPNDGAVPYKSAILPYTWYLTLSGIDHAGAVMDCSLHNIDRYRLSRSLFTLLFHKME